MVFLSHTSADHNIVHKINEALLNRQIPTWIDESDVQIGESIIAAIQKGLSQSDLLLFFISRVSLNRAWVSEEWQSKFYEQVCEGRIKVIPVKLEGVPQEILPPFLWDKKAITIFDDGEFEQKIEQLVQAIRIHAEI